VLLLIAGHETPVNLIGNCLADWGSVLSAILEQPDREFQRYGERYGMARAGFRTHFRPFRINNLR
jgi:cytochrome P450